MLVTQIRGKQASYIAEQPAPVQPQPPPPGLEPPPPAPVILPPPVLQPVTPPQDLQLVIDKMASYVAKNGADFEAVVRNKGELRRN